MKSTERFWLVRLVSGAGITGAIRYLLLACVLFGFYLFILRTPVGAISNTARVILESHVGSSPAVLISVVIFALGFFGVPLYILEKQTTRIQSTQECRKVTPEAYPKLYNRYETLCSRASVSPPDLYIYNDKSTLNAYAIQSLTSCRVAVSERLITECTSEEICAAIAHELAHIKNRDSLVKTIGIATQQSFSRYFAFFFQISLAFLQILLYTILLGSPASGSRIIRIKSNVLLKERASVAGFLSLFQLFFVMRLSHVIESTLQMLTQSALHAMQKRWPHY